MGNCCKCRRKPKRNIVLLLVGLDNAGKTVAVKGLAGENSENSIPTVGFSVVNLNHSNYNVQIYDLGGGSEIRGIWHRYFVDAHGVIFVVDASDYDRFDEVQLVLDELLSHEKISGKPLLFLANKQDNQEALDEIDIVEKLQLEHLVNQRKCPTLVESCSAKDLDRGQLDRGIENGYRWLLNYILKDYDSLNDRVDRDVQEQRELDDAVRREKMERFKITNNSAEDISDHEMIQVDPFRPINELVTPKEKLFTESIQSPNHSIPLNDPFQIRSPVVVDRPKSALELVKKQLQQTNRRNSILTFTTNKTAPITLISPKSAPCGTTPLKENTFNTITATTTTQFRTANETGQILTVTELPNAIIDANGENIGDLFELTDFSATTKRLPPLRQKNIDEYHMSWMDNKPLRNTVNVRQTNVDEIYKDIS